MREYCTEGGGQNSCNKAVKAILPLLKILYFAPTSFLSILPPIYPTMGRVRHEFSTPKKARSFGLLERGFSRSAAAKELDLDRVTAWRWT
jgi:hypothetical protein